MAVATKGKLKGLELRPTQAEGIEFVRDAMQNGYKFIALRAPTGIGKTCLGFESMPQPFYYVCSSIALQEQAEKDYGPEAVLLKGKSNYYCPTYGTADLCLKGVIKKRGGGDTNDEVSISDQICPTCEYRLTYEKAMMSEMTIINYHYYLFSANFSHFPRRNIIIDEADDLETAIVDFISFDFTDKKLAWMGFRPNMPNRKTKMDEFARWIDEKFSESELLLNDLEPIIKEIKANSDMRKLKEQEKVTIKLYKELNSLQWKMRFLARQDLEKDWAYYYNDFLNKKVTVKPIWISRDTADTFFFKHGDTFLFMSATLPVKEVFCQLYGLKNEEVAYKDLPNVWDNSRRKIILKPSYNLSYKNKTAEMFKKVRETVREIISKERGRGVIHTVNYEFSRLLADLSRRIVTHGPKDKNVKFELFKKTPAAIWVSPSSARGIDLPYDLCEWVIWLKAPFLNIKDPQVEARIYKGGDMGKLWYAADACQAIVQGSGRGFRSEDDYCTVYFLDEEIEKLLTTKAGLFPLWFRDLVEYEPEEWEGEEKGKGMEPMIGERVCAEELPGEWD